MSKHTPGPWYPVMRMVEVEGNAPDICTTNIELFGQRHLHRSKQEQIANARLIAAAPDLLALLEELVAIEGPQPGTGAWADKVFAVLAKAKGAA